MIHFVVTSGHGYTLAGILKEDRRARELPVALWTYRMLFEAQKLPGGTWIFADLERLAAWELRLAGEIARLMREARSGFRIVNDPARAASRYELLLRLHQAGFNRFRAWRAEDGVPPARFPVFVRFEADHGYPVTGLLRTREELAAALQELPRRGIPLRGAVIIEYHSEELRPGVFRKFSAYRFGSRIVADHIIYDVKWLAKYGDLAALDDRSYAEEVEYVRNNPYAGELMRAFEIGAIDYGRADYGIVGGKVQVWEINTNPYLPAGQLDKVPPERVEATMLSRENRLNALEALDSSSDTVVYLQSDTFELHRRRQRDHVSETVRP